MEKFRPSELHLNLGYNPRGARGGEHLSGYIYLETRPNMIIDESTAGFMASDRKLRGTIRSKILGLLYPEHPEFPGDVQKYLPSKGGCICTGNGRT